jgi:hypothetical protein
MAEPSPDYLPGELKLSWHSLTPAATIASVSVAWNGKALNYEASRRSSVKGTKDIKRLVTPSEPAWIEFWKSLDEQMVWQWLGDYPNPPGAAPDRNWSLVIERGTKKVASRGTNSFPRLGDVTQSSDNPAVFNRFWYAVDRLLSRSIEVEGTYQAGFERSLFEPSTEEYKGQRWWLQGTSNFYDRYARFHPKDDKLLRITGTKVLVRLRGRLVGPGEYGHLSQYEYELIVEQVLEMKPAHAN